MTSTEPESEECGRLRRAGANLTPHLERGTRPVRRIWPRLPEALIGIVAILIVVFALSTYSTTISTWASELFQSDSKLVAVADGLLNPYRNPHLLTESDLPIYNLKITRQNYIALQNVAAEARKRGVLTDDLKIWVNAKLYYQGERYDVKVRIRGDLPPHWEGPKKSYAIKFSRQTIRDGGQVRQEQIYFGGKRQIGLIIPADREYALSYFVNSVFRDQGLVVPRDQFVVLRINGALQGIYYEAEDFDNALLISYDRPETGIVGQNGRAAHFDRYLDQGTAVASDARYGLGSTRIDIDPGNGLAKRAMQVLYDFALDPGSENLDRVRHVLDWEKYLRMRAMTVLLNTNHARFGSDNFKLYYDSSRGLLEPVPWDLHLVAMPREPGTIDYYNTGGPDPLERVTIETPELRLERNRILWELVSDGGDALRDRFDEIHEKYRPLVWADVLTVPFGGQKMDQIRSRLFSNIERVHSVLAFSSADLVYRLEGAEQASIEVVSTNFSGTRVREVAISDPEILEGSYNLYEDVNGDGLLDSGDPLVEEATATGGTLRLFLDRTILPNVRYDSDILADRYWEFYDTLSGRERFFLVGKVAAEVRDPVSWTPPVIDVQAENAVTGLPMETGLVGGAPPHGNSVAVVAYDASDAFDLSAEDLSQGDFLAPHPQFTASTERPGAVELAGSVQLAETVIVPSSVPLVVRPGADVTLAPDVSLVAYGGLTMIGTAAQPIRIHGDGTGRPWGTFSALRPPATVVLEHTEIEGGGQAQVNGTLFTGGFAVHNGDFEGRDCVFRDMQSEDAINVKYGNVLLERCTITGTASDAIDMDAGTGMVRDSSFSNIAGDGVDLSYVVERGLTVAGNRFADVGDKCVSVGENSHPIIVDNLFVRCNIGVSSKDLSHARIAYSTFVDNGTAIEVKRKKPEFGPGTAEVANSVFVDNTVFVDEDVFSRGGADLHNVLLSRSIGVGCQACWIGEIRFRAPQSGDYRLAPEELRGFEVAALEWATVDGMPVRSPVPGVLLGGPAA